MIVFCFILFVVVYFFWVQSSAFMEGILYSGKASDAYEWDEHRIFMVQRISTLFLVLLGAFLRDHIFLIHGLFFFVGLLFIYPFFHDGFYYECRKDIDKPSYNFFSTSKESTAVMEFSWPVRLTLFLIGVSCFIFSILSTL